MRTCKAILNILLTLIVMLPGYLTFGQEKYLPGFIISAQGDTLKGYIDYRNWDRNPDKVFFKEHEESPRLMYTPMDIKGFGVLDESYISAIIETEVSPVNTSDLTYDAELTFETDTTFLQTVVMGIKSLYYYKNHFGKEQFYILQDSSLNLLVYKKYLKEQAHSADIAEYKKYVGQLTLYLNDCPTIQKKLQGTEYQKNSLEKLFLFYYDCTNTAIEFHKKTEKPTTTFGVVAGASITSLKFKSNDFDYLVNAGYNPSVNFSGGIFADVILTRNQGKWSIYNELLFSSYKVSGKFDEFVHEDKYIITWTTIGYSYIKMNNMVRFTYPAGKVSLIMNMGISNGYAIAEKNYLKKESKLFEQVRIEEGKALNDTRRYEIGGIAGLGLKFWNFTFEARYEIGNGMSTYKFLTSSTNRFYFLLGYGFLRTGHKQHD